MRISSVRGAPAVGILPVGVLCVPAAVRRIVMLRSTTLGLVCVSIGLVAACRDDPLARKICTPGAVECLDNGAARVCADSGTRWVNSACPEGEVCRPNAECNETGDTCVDSCRPVICTPGQLRCHSDNNYVLECDESGTRFCLTGSCAAPPINGVCGGEGACVAVCSPLQKTYLGCEYFGVDLDNARGPVCGGRWCDAAAEQYAVVVANPDPENTAFVIVTDGELGVGPEIVEGECISAEELEAPEHFISAAVVPPKGLEILELPAQDFDRTIKKKGAYRIASNIPITVYQFNPLENVDVFSNDASLLLPTSTADVEYYVMTREAFSPLLRGYFTVVGITDEPTEVTVTVTARTLGGDGIPVLAPPEVDPALPQSWTTFLERYEVLNIESDQPGGDLTGTHIVADGPVAVFGGHEAGNSPTTSLCTVTTGVGQCEWELRPGNEALGPTACGCTQADGPNCDPHEPCRKYITCCADHLEQQLFPVSAWGRRFVGARSYPRGPACVLSGACADAPLPPVELEVWRILAAHDDTHVTLDPPVATIPTLAEGEFFELETSSDIFIESDAPVLVGQFLSAERAPGPANEDGDAGIGDPAFILSVPERQFRTTYVFLAPNKYAEDYVTIMAKNGTGVLLDGDDARSKPRALVEDIGAGSWQSIRAPIVDGAHTLICDEPCGIMVHGYDQFVSYGYPGGLNLFECLRDEDCPGSRPFCRENACVADPGP